MRVRTIAGCTAAIALVAGVTGCSAQTAKKAADGAAKVAVQPLAALQRATDNTGKYGSAEVDMTTTMPGHPGVEMKGTYSWGDGPAYDVDLDAASSGMAQLVTTKTVNARFVKGAYYYHVDAQPSGPLKGKHWVRVDASAVLGANAASMSGGNADPTQGLRSLKFAKNATVVGKETVLGRATTHYHASLSKADLGAAGKAVAPDDRKSLLSQFTGKVDRVVFDVWVDGHDLPVRLNEELGAMQVSMDFEKFGATKKVQAPPSSDTADLSKQVAAQRPGGTAS